MTSRREGHAADGGGPISRRRLLLAGLLLAPVATGAQGPTRVPRVGVLLPGDPPTRPTLEAFRAGLRDLGYVEGRTIALELRWNGDRTERWPPSWWDRRWT